MKRTELPKNVQNWLEWLEDSLISDSQVHWDTLAIHDIGEQHVSISFDVDYFEFIKALEAFPTVEFYLYGMSVNTETVSFQCVLMTADEYYKEQGF